jgi:hypothetical protein
MVRGLPARTIHFFFLAFLLKWIIMLFGAARIAENSTSSY